MNNKDVWKNPCDATWGKDPLHLCNKPKNHEGACTCTCGTRKP